ncbi:ADP-ribosylation factor [Tanacetum coccineum]
MFLICRVDDQSLPSSNFDLSCLQGRQPFWKHFLHGKAGLIFVVDSNDRDRIAETRNELHKLLNEDVVRDDAVLLVFANKQDLPNSMTVTEITEKLDLQSFQQRHWHIQSTCAISGEGLYEGLEWLSNNIANKPIFPASPTDSEYLRSGMRYMIHNEELKSMFEKQAGVEWFDLIQTFHACKQDEGKPVGPYVIR